MLTDPILCTLRDCRADVLLLSAGVTLVCALLKKTALKRCPKKVYFFLPFGVGIVLFAAYRSIATLSVYPLSEGWAETLEGGLSCGSAATALYVLYEQFLRKEKGSPLYDVLEGLVPEEMRKEAADALAEGKDAPDPEAFAMGTLALYAEGLSEAELALAAKLIVRLYAAMK